MACSRGCCASQREHYRSLAFRGEAARTRRKVTEDRESEHGPGFRQVEHADDRVDVTVVPKTVVLRKGKAD